jgi:hypothetical protein
LPSRKTLSDLLDATVKTIGATWTTTVVVGGLLFVPAAWMLGDSYTYMFEWISQTMHRGARGDMSSWHLLGQLARVYAWSLAAAALFALASMAVRGCVALHAARAAAGEPADLRDIVPAVVRGSLLRLVGQSALVAAMAAAVMAAAVVPAVLAIVAAAALRAPVLAGVLAVLFVGAGSGVVVWINVRFALAPESIVIGRARVDASLDESARLVKGVWWRLLGRLLVVSLVVGFGTSLLEAPVAAFTILPAYVEIFRSFAAPSHEQLDLMVDAFESLAALGGPLAFMTWLGSVAGSFVTPVFMALLYLDLKAARQEAEVVTAGPPQVDAAAPQPPAGPPAGPDGQGTGQ